MDALAALGVSLFRWASGPEMTEFCDISSARVNTEELPDTITAGGKTRRVSQYFRDDVTIRPDRQMVTAGRIEQVLENWLFRCVTTSGGREGQTYWGQIRYNRKDRLMKVVVSLDDDTIVNAYLDDKATRDWQTHGRRYFDRRCKDGSFEERL